MVERRRQVRAVTLQSRFGGGLVVRSRLGLVLVSALIFLAVLTGGANASPSTMARCLKATGATTMTKSTTYGLELKASWRSNDVSIWTLPSHAVAVAFKKAGTSVGKPTASNVIAGRVLATFYKIPSKADLARVGPCIRSS
jgi:hypothetical protein